MLAIALTDEDSQQLAFAFDFHLPLLKMPSALVAIQPAATAVTPNSILAAALTRAIR